MKKMFLACLALSSALSYGADVTTWYYAFAPQGEGDKIYSVSNDTSVGAGSITWTDSWTNGYWYRLDENDAKIWSTSVPESLADVGLVYGVHEDYNGNRPTLAFNLGSSDSLTLASLEIGTTTGSTDDGAKISFGRNANQGNVVILGDLSKTSWKSCFITNADSITVMGNVVMPGGNLAIEGNLVKVLDVHGSFVGTHTQSGQFYSNIYGAGTISNPSIKVGGIVKNVIFYSKPQNVGATSSNYIQVGGVGERGALNREAPAGYGQANGISYFILTNASDAASAQNFHEKNGSIWTDQSGVMSYIMNGTANQTFSTNSAFLHGGIKVVSGGMFINFNQGTGNYTYNDSASNTVTFFTQNGGTTRAQFSHGDLEMGVAIDGLTSAGAEAVFGSAAGDDTYGSFRFTNVVYASGTIKLRLNSATQMDTLDLTSYAKFNSSDSSWKDVAGGTLKFAEGVAEGTQVKFDFGDNLAWLVDSEGDGVKVISWDVDKKTELVSEDFAANLFEGEDGLSYMAEFTVGDDGLYVKYVVVPEPAELACLIGFGALAFAALRRRRK